MKRPQHLPPLAAAALCAIAATAAPSCGGSSRETPGPPPIFVEDAAGSGIDFVHWNGMSGEFYLAEIMGAGCALLDYDGDGDLDAYLVQGGLLGPGKSVEDALLPPPAGPLRDRLYRNDLVRAPDGVPRARFTDVTGESRIDARGYGMGVATGDYDGDGDVDLYLTNYGANQLWRNEGDGTFTEVGAAAGVDDATWSVSAAFVDYDRDGRLDLYVGNYVDFRFANHKACYSKVRDYCSPSAYNPVPDRLYRNRGDGRFEDVSATAGVAADRGNALGVVTVDLDRDGWPDIYVANDGTPNLCWINRGDGRFANTALLAGCALNEAGQAEAGMGVDAGDFDGDGDDDLFVTHLSGETNTLYLNDGRGTFEDRTIVSGLGPPSRAFTGFGTAWFDYDNDGWLDLLVVNGAVTLIEELLQAGDPYPLHQPNRLYRNLGQLRFEDVTERAGAALALSEVSRGAAFGDVDDDGDVDVLISNNNGPARLLLNQLGNRNHWLGLRLIGDDGAVVPGTRVAVVRRDGTALWRRARSDASYASANDPRVLFGLGSSAELPRVRALWPEGRVETWSVPGIDRWITLRAGTGEEVE